MPDPTRIALTVPGTPPSVNHYKSRRFWRYPEARRWDETVAALVAGRKLRARSYSLRVELYLAKGQRLDADNSLKCIADSLQRCGAIHSDAAITEINVRKFRDRDNPRTEIEVTAP